MRNKKFLLLLALVITTVLVIAGCSSNTSSEPKKDNATRAAQTGQVAEPAKVVSLVEQVKQSGHYKLFPTMVAKGPSVKDPKGEHYGDGCIRCHSEVKILDDKDAKLDDFFPGGKYANNTAGITCIVCHKFEGKDMVSLRNTGWDTCGVCHVSSNGNPKPGDEVHHPQFQMIKGVAIGDFPAKPSYKYDKMRDSFSCTDCHLTNSQKHDFMVPGVTATHDPEGIKRTGTKIDYEQFKQIFKQDKCVTCHADPQPVVDKLKAHQEEISKKLEELKPIYDEWSKKVQTMDKNDPKVIAFKNGATFYTFVDADGSKGAHNYEYAKAALEKAQTLWQALK